MSPLNPLTGLRGIAAYSVLVAHGISASFGYGGINPAQPFASRLAYFGMSLFFVLSGFVIHYNYSQPLKEKGFISGSYQFFIARFARLYPLYGLIFLCTLDSIPSSHFHNKQMAELAYLTLTQSWFNLQTITFSPAWSISTECFFYLFFVLTLWFFERITKPAPVLFFYLTLCFIFLPNLIHYQLELFKDTGWVTYFSPFTRVFDFIAGMLSSKYFLQRQHANRNTKPIEYLILSLCISWIIGIIFFDFLQHTQFAILLPNFIFTPAISILLLICCLLDSKNKLLCNKIIMTMGEISYSVYLFGFTIITALGNVYVSTEAKPIAYVNSCLKIGAIITLTSLIAYGGYHLIEAPARRFFRRRLCPLPSEKIFPLGGTAQIGSTQ